MSLLKDGIENIIVWLKSNICWLLFANVLDVVHKMAAKLFDSPDMRETIRRLIRARMAYKGFEYKDLVEKLEALGVHQAESNLRSKVNNGSLGAQLFVFILLALDISELEMNQVREVLADVSTTREATQP
jgi:predicted RNA-binding Zn ribbon-like protein